MHNSVAVALIGAAEGVGEFVVHPAERGFGMHRPGGEGEGFAGFPVGVPGGDGVGGIHGRSCSHRLSKAWGNTRTPATDGMKFTSPVQRGTICQCR